MPSPIRYNYIYIGGVCFHIYENFTLKKCIILCKKRALCEKNHDRENINLFAFIYVKLIIDRSRKFC